MRIETQIGPLNIIVDGYKNVPIQFATERREYRIFGWHLATVYVQDLEFEPNNIVRSRWLYVGPKNFGVGLVVPWR